MHNIDIIPNPFQLGQVRNLGTAFSTEDSQNYRMMYVERVFTRSLVQPSQNKVTLNSEFRLLRTSFHQVLRASKSGLLTTRACCWLMFSLFFPRSFSAKLLPSQSAPKLQGISYSLSLNSIRGVSREPCSPFFVLRISCWHGEGNHHTLMWREQKTDTGRRN